MKEERNGHNGIAESKMTSVHTRWENRQDNHSKNAMIDSKSYINDTNNTATAETLHNVIDIKENILNSLYAVLEEDKDLVTVEEIQNYMSGSYRFENSSKLRKLVQEIMTKEGKSKKGKITEIIQGKYGLKEKSNEILGDYIKQELQSLGFIINSEGITRLEEDDSKIRIRNLHSVSRYEKYSALRNLVNKKEDILLGYFSNGNEIDLSRLEPRLEVVQPDSWQNDLFRYATLLWSVPVSNGFGRRTRFLVWDKANKKLIGLFALGDPVFNLKCRDQWIGWNSHDREKRLYNVMDIFVLGSVPPYNQLLGGKLIALLAASNEVRNVIRKKYRGRKTIIDGIEKYPNLALLTTGSALGKSSLYDRVKFQDKLIYNYIGTSEGWGHFHFGNDVFEGIRSFIAANHPREDRKYKFGQGPNWKLRTIKYGLEGLGLNPDLLRHGIKREIYGVPLAENFREFLLGEEKKLNEIDLKLKDITPYFKERWLFGRAERKPEFLSFNKREIRRTIRYNGGVEQ